MTPGEQTERSIRSVPAGLGSIYLAAAAAQLAAGIVVTPIVTRLLDPAEFGRLAIAQIVTQVCVIVISLGLPAGVFREVFEPGGGPRRARALTATLIPVSSALAAALLMAAVVFDSAFDAVVASPEIRVAIATAVPTTWIVGAQALLRAQGKAIGFGASSIASSVGAQLAGIAALATGGGAFRFLVALLAARTVTAVVVMLAGRTVLWPATGKVVRSALRYGVPTMPHSAALLALVAADRFLVESYAGLEAVGRYQVAYVVGSLVLLGLGAYDHAWGRSVLQDADPHEALAGSLDLAHLLAAVGVVVVALLGPTALLFLAPGAYDPDGLRVVVALIAASSLPYVVYLTWVKVLAIDRRNGALLWLAPMALIVNIFLNVLLIPSHRLVGAAIATLVAYAVLAVAFRQLPSVKRNDALRRKEASSIARWWGCPLLMLVVGSLVSVDIGGNLLRGGLAVAVVAGMIWIGRVHILGSPIRELSR